MFDNESLEAYLQITGVITQAELPIVRAQGRLGEYAVVYRIYRNKQGGGFGDTGKKPFAWAVLVYADGFPLRLNSARGDCREWSTLESVSDWMRKNGFRYWWTRNDLEFEPVEVPAAVETSADVGAAISPELQPAAAPAIDPAIDPAITVQPYAYGNTAAAYISETNIAPYTDLVTESHITDTGLPTEVETVIGPTDIPEAGAGDLSQDEALEQENNVIGCDGAEEKTN